MERRYSKAGFLLFCLFMTLSVIGQQNNIWCFGINACISFTPDSSLGVPHPQIPSYNCSSIGGCSDICDDNGNFLFSCYQNKIYNRFNKVMQNGDSLMSCFSEYDGFQASLIVPQPNSPNIYYVFTADCTLSGFFYGYRYSIVDMTLDGGAGAVVTKNILLSASGTERLTGARHADGVDVWIMVNDHNSNVFRAYLLTCTGLQPAVVSASGVVFGPDYTNNAGTLKVSPNGKLICQTHGSQNESDNFLQLFDFDNATGIVSNPRIITPDDIDHNCASAFSPDSRLVYMTNAAKLEIEQFDCTAGNANAITSSRYIIPLFRAPLDIQLAPDQKIYIDQNAGRLSVIDNPNIMGPGCGLELDKIELSGLSGSAFPNFINDLSVDVYNYFTSDNGAGCSGTVQFSAFTRLASTVSYQWDFGDGNTSSQPSPVHTYADPKKLYLVTLTMISSAVCGSIRKSKMIRPASSFATAAFEITSPCDSRNVQFTNHSSAYPANTPVQYYWDFGDGNNSSDQDPSHIFGNAGSYSVKLKTIVNSCITDSTVEIVDFTPVNLQVSPAQTITAGQSVQITASGNADHYQWAPVEGLSNPYLANPFASPADDITYIVTASAANGCTAKDSVFIKVNHTDGIYVPTAFTPNHDGRNDVLRPLLGSSYTLNYFTVYNRWGELIFKTSQVGNGWDGKLDNKDLDAGVYVWILKVTDQNKKVTNRKGTVTLIR